MISCPNLVLIGVSTVPVDAASRRAESAGGAAGEVRGAVGDLVCPALRAARPDLVREPLGEERRPASRAPRGQARAPGRVHHRSRSGAVDKRAPARLRGIPLTGRGTGRFQARCLPGRHVRKVTALGHEPRYVHRMGSVPAGWLPLVFTTLGAGAAGSLLASYGSQARGRRAARSEAMAFLQRIEIARGRRPINEGNDFDDNDLAELESRCLLAGISRRLVDLYKLTNESGRYRGGPNPPGSGLVVVEDPAVEELRELVRHELIVRAAGLLASTVWHPWLTAPIRWWHARRLRRVLFRTDPSTAWLQRRGRRSLYAWEADLRARLERDQPRLVPASAVRAETGITPGGGPLPSTQAPWAGDSSPSSQLRVFRLRHYESLTCYFLDGCPAIKLP